jgi:hypothetical protein
MPVVFALLVVIAIAGPIVAWKAGVAMGSSETKAQLNRFRDQLVEEFKERRKIPHAQEVIFAAYKESELGCMAVYSGPERLQDVPVVVWPENQGKE